MKKTVLMFVLLLSAMTMSAQKFALLDMEYILKNISAYNW
jgi:outer membrane protein